jgi:uncharacterized protein (DUF3820 family)
MEATTNTALTDQSPMPIGKHRGEPMIKVPAAYLLWLYNAGCDHQRVRQYIIDNLDALKQEVKNLKR